MSCAAVVGVGLTPMSLEPGTGAPELAAEAIRHAVQDACLQLGDVDGLLVNASQVESGSPLGIEIGARAGLGPLRLLAQVEMKGASAGALLVEATRAIVAGKAQRIVCVFADAPIVAGSGSGSMFAQHGGAHGVRGIERASGLLGAVPAYALAASRFMHQRAISEQALGHVAVSARSWAMGNPAAVARGPLSLDEHAGSPMVAEPLRRLDCARPVNGAAAFVVSADRPDSDRPGVRLLGSGEWHPGRRRIGPAESWFDDAPIPAGEEALLEAGVLRDQIDVVQLYDPFTIVTLCLLEAYGFAERGAVAELVAAGEIGPGGSLPVNTGGGQLSGWYLQGMTPLIEALLQLRGVGEGRQVRDAELAFVGLTGGRIDHHLALVLGRES